FWASEVTGAATTSPLDPDSGQATGAQTTGTGTPSVTTSGTLDQANNIVFAVTTHNVGDRDFSAPSIQGASATEIGEQQSNSAGQCGHVFYRIISSSSSVQSTCTIGSGTGSGFWGIFHGIYKEAAVEAEPGGTQFTRRKFLPYQLGPAGVGGGW